MGIIVKMIKIKINGEAVNKTIWYLLADRVNRKANKRVDDDCLTLYAQNRKKIFVIREGLQWLTPSKNHRDNLETRKLTTMKVMKKKYMHESWEAIAEREEWSQFEFIEVHSPRARQSCYHGKFQKSHIKPKLN